MSFFARFLSRMSAPSPAAPSSSQRSLRRSSPSMHLDIHTRFQTGDNLLLSSLITLKDSVASQRAWFSRDLVQTGYCVRQLSLALKHGHFPLALAVHNSVSILVETALRLVTYEKEMKPEVVVRQPHDIIIQNLLLIRTVITLSPSLRPSVLTPCISTLSMDRLSEIEKFAFLTCKAVDRYWHAPS